MIPKKIHYVWVGDKPKPELVLKCIASWKKHLPDYEIIEWGNDILNTINNKYVQEATLAKKWAFVSDYLRLYALYHHGGIYLDTDIVVNYSLDNFLKYNFFMGFESFENKQYPMTALIGSTPNNKIIADMLNIYSSLSFITPKNTYDMKANTLRFGEYFLKNFPTYTTDDLYTPCFLNQESVIFPPHYFFQPHGNLINYTIHLGDASWIDGYNRRDKAQLFNLRITRFKRISNKNDKFPLWNNEKIIWKVKFSDTRIYALTITKQKKKLTQYE